MRCIDGTELTVEFTVLAQPFVRLNGGPNFKANEAISFMVLEVDARATSCSPTDLIAAPQPG